MFRTLLFATLGVLVAFTSADADFIQYGDFVGDNVSYIDVTENSITPGALYGQPDIAGDALEFPGTGFISQSEDGAANLLDGRLSLIVESNNGQEFSSITIEEFGAYLTFGNSVAFVNAVAFVETGDGIFQSEFQFTATGSNVPDGGGWLESLTVSFPATTYAELTFDNQLFTSAGPLGAAFIDKKGINVWTNAVPEPASAGMLLAVGAAALARRRR